MAHSTFTFSLVQTQTMSVLDYFHFRIVGKKRALPLILVVIMEDTRCIAEEEVSTLIGNVKIFFIFELKN